MKKAILLLAVICGFCIANAQNVGDEFVEYSLKYKITSINPNTVTLMDARSITANRTFDTVTHDNQVYDITNVNSSAFRDVSNSNFKFYFKKLTKLEEGAFYALTCNTIDLQETSLTEICKNAFYLTTCPHIILPDQITKILQDAFMKSSSITSINTPNVTYIGYSAFEECTNLASIDLSKVTHIGGYAFYECSKLKNIVLPKCLETVEGEAFSFCYLQSLTMFNTTKVFQKATHSMAENGTVNMHIVNWRNKNVLSGTVGFDLPIHYDYGGAAVTGSYTLSDTVTSLGEGALFHCTDLTAITLPASITQMGAKALAKCTNLTAITSNATTAPAVANADAFNEVSKTIPVNIPDNAEAYYSYTHATGWKDFTNYQVSLSTIQGAAIMDLWHTAGNNPSPAIQSIIESYADKINAANDKETIESLTQEGINAIIEQLYVDRNVVKINGIYYILDNNNHTATVTYGGLESEGYATAEYTGSITIPASVEFESATYQVTTIGQHAFHNCSSVTGITLPESITVIEDYAFQGCTKIQNLTLPSKITTIGNYAFYGCSGLKTLVLPYMISSIGNSAFMGCSALTAITCYAPTPCSLGWGAFNDVNKSIPVTVPGNSLTDYQNAHWGEFSNFVTNKKLDDAKSDAQSAIIAAMGSYSSINYIGTLALNFCMQIEAAMTVDEVNALGTEGVYAVRYSIKAYEAFLGTLGTEQEGPVVEVTGQDGKVLKLYNPKNVRFLKETGTR